MPKNSNTKEPPLSVAISALIHQNKILLIKRVRGDYIGLWGLPGGKIEKDEHLSAAAIREIFEESGIESEFNNHLAIVSEHLMEKGNILKHLLLHVCELTPKFINIINNTEGILNWFDLDKIEEHKHIIIPSDVLMIEKIIKNRESTYYNCILEKVGDNYLLRKFE